MKSLKQVRHEIAALEGMRRRKGVVQRDKDAIHRYLVALRWVAACKTGFQPSSPRWILSMLTRFRRKGKSWRGLEYRQTRKPEVQEDGP